MGGETLEEKRARLAKNDRDRRERDPERVRATWRAYWQRNKERLAPTLNFRRKLRRCGIDPNTSDVAAALATGLNNQPRDSNARL